MRLTVKVGRTYTNGKSQRYVVRIEPPYIHYKAKPDSLRTTSELLAKFEKWVKSEVMIPEEQNDSLIENYRKLVKRERADLEMYLRAYYHILPRKELARRTGIPKFDLNMLLIEMGLGR